MVEGKIMRLATYQDQNVEEIRLRISVLKYKGNWNQVIWLKPETDPKMLSYSAHGSH